MANYSKSIDDFYKNADKNDQYEKTWGYANPVAAAYWRIRDEIIFDSIISRTNLGSKSLRVLEIGVGHGHELAKFSQLNIPGGRLYGIDLVINRIIQAEVIYPYFNYSQQDGTKLAFENETFDVVYQITCLMHLPTKMLQLAVCQEMVRVLKPGGIVIWWDVAPLAWPTSVFTRWCNVRSKGGNLKPMFSLFWEVFWEALSLNKRVNKLSEFVSSYTFPISIDEISVMFEGNRVDAKYVGVGFPIWDYLWRRNRSLAQIVWRTGWLYQHCFAVIEKASK
jgi:SAM-dependent methyltransferase